MPPPKRSRPRELLAKDDGKRQSTSPATAGTRRRAAARTAGFRVRSPARLLRRPGHSATAVRIGRRAAAGSLLDFDHRLKAIGEFAKLPEAEALAAANKRIRNILRKVEGAIPSTIDPALLTPGAEQDLADAVAAAITDTDDALKQRDYVAVLGRLARLRPQVDAFFDSVMVNVDDSAIRNNRLALLQRLSDRLGSVAAIEHLSA